MTPIGVIGWRSSNGSKRVRKTVDLPVETDVTLNRQCVWQLHLDKLQPRGVPHKTENSGIKEELQKVQGKRAIHSYKLDSGNASAYLRAWT